MIDDRPPLRAIRQGVYIRKLDRFQYPDHHWYVVLEDTETRGTVPVVAISHDLDCPCLRYLHPRELEPDPEPQEKIMRQAELEWIMLTINSQPV